MTAPLTAEYLGEADYGGWDQFVAASPEGSAYSTSDYLGALCEATGSSFRVMAAKKGGEIVGGIALLEQPHGRGTRIAPRPLHYYNGLVLRDFATRYPSQRTSRILEVSGLLEARLSSAGHATMVLKHRASFVDARSFMARGWTVRPGYSYLVPIADIGGAWDRVEHNLRRLITRCTREGAQLTEDTDFDSFMRLHVAGTARKGVAPYLPERQFARFFERLRKQDMCRLYHARLPNGQSVSAQLVLTGKHPVSHSVCAATDAAHFNSGVTAFLRWKVFEALSSMGYAGNDLTDAALNPVTHFKSQLGGRLELCLICEKSPAPMRLRERVASKISKILVRRT